MSSTKLRLAIENEISLTKPEHFCSNQFFTVFYRESKIFIVDKNFGKLIKSFRFENVAFITFSEHGHGECLLVLSTDLHILNTTEFEIVDICKISETVVTSAKLYGRNILVCKADGKSFLYEILENEKQIMTIFEYEFVSMESAAFVSQNFFGSFSPEKQLIFNKKGEIVLQSNLSGIISVVEIENNQLLLVDVDGKVYDGTECSVVFDLDVEVYGMCIISDRIVVNGGDTFFFFDVVSKTVEKIYFADILYKHAQFDSKGLLIPISSENFNLENKVVELTNEYMVTSDGDIILHLNLEIEKIYSFSVNISKFRKTSEFLIFSTSTGCLKYSPYSSKNFFECFILPISTDSVTCIESGGIDENIIFIGTSRGLCMLFSVIDNSFALLSKWEEKEEVSCAIFTQSYLAYSVGDITLVIRNQTGEVVCSKKIHRQRITNILRTKEYLITVSDDKMAKKISLTPDFEIVKKVKFSEKPLSIVSDEDTLYVSSLKYIWVVRLSDLQIIKTLSVPRPVLSSEILSVESENKKYFLAASDGIKVFSTEGNPLFLQHMNLLYPRYFKFPFIFCENKIIKISYTMEKVVGHNEYRMYELAEDYTSLIKFEKNQRKQFRFLKKDLSDDTVRACGSLGKILVQNGQTKDISFFGKVVNKYFTHIDNMHLKDVEKILIKHFDVVDDIWCTLLALDIYE